MKVRLEMTLMESNDTAIQAVAPTLATRKKWTAKMQYIKQNLLSPQRHCWPSLSRRR